MAARVRGLHRAAQSVGCCKRLLNVRDWSEADIERVLVNVYLLRRNRHHKSDVPLPLMTIAEVGSIIGSWSIWIVVAENPSGWI
jgi:hypothetical protein